MKRLLLLMMTAGVMVSHAAPLEKKKKYVHPEQKYAHELAWANHNARMAAKGTATKKRLIASSYFANGVLIDSNVHKYSNGRGFTPDKTVESYYDNYSMTAITPARNIFCDSSIGWYDYGTGLEWDGTSTFNYDAANNVTRHYIATPYFQLLHEGVYNSSNKLQQIITSDTSGGTALVPKTKMYIMYDGAGRRVHDSTVEVSTGTQVGRRLYFYDAQGNLERYEAYSRIGASTLNLFFVGEYTYDGQGRVVTEATAYNFGLGLRNSAFDSFAYSGAALHPIHHRTATWVDTAGAWDDYEIIDYTLNAQEQPDAYIIYRHINQWDTIERDVYYYDADGLLTGSNGYLFLGNGQFATTPYDRNSLYYEEYDPNSVSESMLKDRRLSISPNPASGQINISVEKEYSLMTITNVAGQTMLSREDIKPGVEQVDISGLPAGNYIINLYQAAEQRTASGKFLKQ